MSRGYYGRAKLIKVQELYIEYAYSGENWNSPDSSEGDALLYDGRIKILVPENTLKIDPCKNDFDRGETKYIAAKIAGIILRNHKTNEEWIKEVDFLI